MSHRAAGAVAALVLLAGAACGSDDDADDGSAPDPTQSAEATSVADHDGCGVTLAEVQALLPADSGATERSTPDAGRCSFTWDDGGPRGIDVATVVGGRSAFEAGTDKVPDGPELLRDGSPYAAVEVEADQAWAFGDGRRVSAVALRGDDLFAVDIVTEGPGDSSAELDPDLLELCTELLRETLD